MAWTGVTPAPPRCSSPDWFLVGYQTLDIRRHPLEPLPMPMNRHTGQPQRPNGEVITVGAG